MEINLEINKKVIESEDSSEKHDLKLHCIPADIDGNGPANVEEYFSQFTQEINGVLMNTFRGYPLQGCDITVPKEYKGVVFQEFQKPLDDNAPRQFKALGTFDNFTYWNYDKIPSRNDSLQKALTIIDIAEACAKDVTEEELEKLISSKGNGC